MNTTAARRENNSPTHTAAAPEGHRTANRRLSLASKTINPKSVRASLHLSPLTHIHIIDHRSAHGNPHHRESVHLSTRPLTMRRRTSLPTLLWRWGVITAFSVSQVQSFQNFPSVVTVPQRQTPCCCEGTLVVPTSSQYHRPPLRQREYITQLQLSGESNHPESKYGSEIVVTILAIVCSSLVATAVTLWSEWAVYQTGCGPLSLPDIVERSSYQVVILVSGVSWFVRIVFRQSLTNFMVQQEFWGTNQEDDHRWNILIAAVGWAESVSYLAVVLAFLDLWQQVQNNVAMDGLSGIDIEACNARRDLFLLQ